MTHLFQDDAQETFGLALGHRVRVEYGTSKRLLASVRKEQGGTCSHVELHAVFRHAPAEIVQALTCWLVTGTLSDGLRAWADDELRKFVRSRTRVACRTEGEHNLSDVADRVLKLHFRKQFSDAPAMTWGQRSRPGWKTIRLGSYDSAGHLVRVHPALDQPSVPVRFVEFVVFHELLHALIEPEGGVAHPPAFRIREREHPDYRWATTWLSGHVRGLIESGWKVAPSVHGLASQCTLFPQ